MITIGYKGRSTSQLSSWARFGHTISATYFEITRRYHSDSFQSIHPKRSTRDRFQNNPKVSFDCAQSVPRISYDPTFFMTSSEITPVLI